MRKILFTTLSLFAFTAIWAQTQQDTLQHYVGKYKFPEGSVVTEIAVSVENGTLLANSTIGTAELRKMEVDVFEIVGYSGTATFKRNAEGKVSTVHIIVGDVNIEGTKTEVAVRTDRLNFIDGKK